MKLRSSTPTRHLAGVGRAKTPESSRRCLDGQPLQCEAAQLISTLVSPGIHPGAWALPRARSHSDHSSGSRRSRPRCDGQALSLRVMAGFPTPGCNGWHRDRPVSDVSRVSRAHIDLDVGNAALPSGLDHQILRNGSSPRTRSSGAGTTSRRTATTPIAKRCTGARASHMCAASPMQMALLRTACPLLANRLDPARMGPSFTSPP